MKKQNLFIITMVIAISGLFSCGELIDLDEKMSNTYKESLPDWNQIAISLPDSAAARFKDSEQTIAETYSSAVSMTRDLNPILYTLLSVVDEIVVYPPTEIDGNRKIWKADEPLNGLSAVVPKFTMGEQEEDGVPYVTYSFEIRHKDDSEDNFRKIWWGRMAPDENVARRGKGMLEIDFDTASLIDPNTIEDGSIIVEYDIRSYVDRSIDIYFENFYSDKAAVDQVLDATYKYVDADDNSGSLSFQVLDRYSFEDSAPDICMFDFDVVWGSEGYGQGTVGVRDCATEQTIDKFELKECWNESFYRTYYSELVYWNKENPPTWADDNLDNPVEIEETKFGDIEECPFEF